MLTQHSKNQNLEEWNCNDCAFQGNCATELMNHLKITTHQPSKNVKDKRKVFQDYNQCFTCKMDFDGFFNLMNHRKSVHPSNKQCRNYATGRCTRGSDCWYVHSEKSENEDIFENFKCDLCAEQFKGRGNFMRHKKISHPQIIPTCEKHLISKCQRNENECWFKHTVISSPRKEDTPQPEKVLPNMASNEKQGFCEPLGNAFPPEQVNVMIELMNKLCRKVQNMEKRFEDLIN